MINKKLLLLCIGLLITTQMIFSQVPSYVPTNGLVGYWPFNGNANDQSGNGNNGTVNGATNTTDRNGNANSAYDFDGTSNYIRLPKITSLNDAASFTFSCWILPEGSTGTRQFVFSRGFDYETGSFFISQESESNSNKVRFSYNGYSNYNILSNQGYSIPYQNWQLLTVTKNGTTVNLYINSILISSSTNTANLSALDEFLYIGSHWYNTQNGSYFPYYFNGKIDDVGIYNRALTQQEITTMYNGVNYSDTCNAVSGSLVNGLVGYWPFCGNANDDSGNGNNGVVNGATLTTDRFGNSNSAYDFDGNSFISVSSTTELCLQNQFTISLWARRNNSTFMGFISKGRDNGGEGVSYHISGLESGAEVGINNDTGGCSSCNIGTTPYLSNNFSSWNHYVGIWDGIRLKLYENGIMVSDVNGVLGDGNALLNTNFPLLFGRWSLSNYLNGQLDDIGIWNRALTQQEITQLYNQNQCITNITVTDTLIINVGQLSYSNPVTYANNITIYPNPANTQVNISFNNITDLTGGNINIINSLGQQVATTPITLSGTTTTMPLNAWGGTGLYFVQILNAQGIVVDVKKIILQ
jgi:hypothetical protein